MQSVKAEAVYAVSDSQRLLERQLGYGWSSEDSLLATNGPVLTLHFVQEVGQVNDAIARHDDVITPIDHHTVFCDGVVAEGDAVAKEGTVGFLNSRGSIDEFTCAIVVIDTKCFFEMGLCYFFSFGLRGRDFLPPSRPR
jgi:hypothetical protein